MRADRLLSIMLILQDQGKLSVARLAELLEVSRRTILRDVDALTVAGIPIYSESGPGGGIYLDAKYRVSLTGLKEAELRSLFAANLAGPLNDIGLGRSAETGFLKLLAALPTGQRTEVERVRQRLYIDPSAWSSRSQPQVLLTDLLTAVFEDRQMNLTYQRGDGKVVVRVLDPYSLVCKANVWYLIGAYEASIHIYRVSRIQQIAILAKTFNRMSEFDLSAFWEARRELYYGYAVPFKCTLEISNQRLQFLTWPFVYDLEIKGPARREGWQTVDLTFDSIEAAEMLILALGQDVTIQAPASLAAAVRQKVAVLTRHYDTHDSSPM